jgi:lipoprotein-releasing system permease protein
MFPFGYSFEKSIALRYLKSEKLRWHIFLGALVLFLLGFLFLYLAGSLFSAKPSFIPNHAPFYYSGLILSAMGVFVTLFALILLFFNVYSTISIFGVFLGTATMVVVLSVLGGLEGEQKRQILKFSPHIVITKKNRKPITNYKSISNNIKNILKSKNIKGILAPFIQEEVLLKSGAYEATQGVLIRGLDPDFPTFDLEAHMKDGSITNLKHNQRLKWLDPDIILNTKQTEEDAINFLPSWPADSPGIIISQEQTRTLGATVGSFIDIISPRGTMSPTGPIPKLIRYRVAGIYSTKQYKYDLKYTFVNLKDAQVFSLVKNSITGWEIRLNNQDDIDRTASLITDKLDDSFEIGTWKTQNKALFNAMKLEKFVMFIILVVIVLVAAFSITANLIMVVMDKRQEISILKSVGSTDKSIKQIFMLQGIFIGFIGIALGLAFGLGICIYLAKVGIRTSENVFMFARIPVAVKTYDIVTITMSSMFLAILATLYPAWKATSISPIEGLNEEE